MLTGTHSAETPAASKIRAGINGRAHGKHHGLSAGGRRAVVGGHDAATHFLGIGGTYQDLSEMSLARIGKKQFGPQFGCSFL